MALSSEELIPSSTAASSSSGEDDVSTFSANLRPTNQRKNTSLMTKEANQRQQNRPPFAGNQQIYSSDSEDDCFENLRNYPFGSSRTNATPETLGLEPISNCSFGESEVDFELNSPSSKYYSSSHSGQKQKASNRAGRKMKSTVPLRPVLIIGERHANRATLMKQLHGLKRSFKLCSDGNADSHGSQNKSGTEEESTKQLQILDEKRRVWSTGKEADIPVAAVYSASYSMAQQWLVRNISNESNPKITSEESLSESAFAVGCYTCSKIHYREGVFRSSGCLGCIYLTISQLAAVECGRMI